MSQKIVILSNLDSKAQEALYLKDQIQAHGGTPVMMDMSIIREPEVRSDISAEAVAKAAGGDIVEIRATQEEKTITPILVKGASMILAEMFNNGELGGVIAFGSTAQTSSATQTMKTLPFGIPKFMVSSAAAMPAYAARYIGTKDMTIVHSVFELTGLNEFTKSVFKRAAAGICGMVEASTGAVELSKDNILIAVTGNKFSEDCSHKVMELLEERGYAAMPIHAQGVGDRAMEELIEQGLYDGVIDVVPAGVSEELFGGNRAAGPHRLESAGRMGIPLVITPSGFDMLSCGPLDRRDRDDPLWTKRRLNERKLFIPDQYRVQVRVNAEETRIIAQTVAQKLNQAKGPVAVFVPNRGWSTLSVDGADLFDPEVDAILAPELRTHLKPEIQVVEKDTDCNSPEFAHALVDALEEMIKAGKP